MLWIFMAPLSMTGKGHLTDYIIHETLGENCQVNFCEETLPFHPNGMVFHIYQDSELKDDITAYSVGGGSIVWEVRMILACQEKMYIVKRI